jgi:class 3 adenylate cyclase/YHS domain-containing protein
MTAQHTFLFADLAGFTALTEAHGDEHAADLVADFAARTRTLLAEYRSEEVKLIGDALMLRSDDAAAAVRLACRIVGEIGGQHGFPAVRVGAHAGQAVERDADWFGATVNLASRISAAAAAGEVLISAATKEAIGDGLAECSFRFIGSKRFKNVREQTEVYSVVDSGLAQRARGALAIDPVCHMSVDTAVAGAQRTYRGRGYWFCSEACATAFGQSPGRYVRGRPSRADLRISDRSRDRAAAFLRRAYQHGRLELDDLDERLAHVMVARTRRELSASLTDLPGGRMRRRGWRRLRPRRGR